MAENNDYIDLLKVFQRIWGKKRIFFIVWAITFVVSCAIILPVPRVYTSSLQLVPESSSKSSTGSLASLAGSFGINLGSIAGEDAFYPDIYPDVISTNEFIVGLFGIHVESEDHEIQTDYYTYMKDYVHKPFYKYPKIWVVRLIRKMFPQPDFGTGTGAEEFSPNHLNKETDALVEKIRDNISCSIDKKTGVITIQVSAQDPLICATMADSVRVRLQNFITEYRTRKARVDVAYYEGLLKEYQEAYNQAVMSYSSFCDSHTNIMLPSVTARRDQLSNELSLATSAYNNINTQYQLSLAKVQENTPSFTTLSRPNVPIRASKPKRMVFVLAMLVLSTFGVFVYLFKNEVIEQIRHMK